MQKLETYGKITSIATSEDEDKKEVKVKVEGIWDLDGMTVQVQVILKGTAFDIEQLFESEPSPGEELKLIIREGAQASLSDFANKDELEEGKQEPESEENDGTEKDPIDGDWSETPPLREEEEEDQEEEEEKEKPQKKKRGRRRKTDEPEG